MDPNALAVDLGKSIKPSSGGKRREFKGNRFKFEKEPTPEPIPRSPLM